MKKMISVLALVLAVALLAGCGASASTKTFTCGEFSITVPTRMNDVSSQYTDYTFALDSTNLAILGINETFVDYPALEEYNTKEYAELVIELYGVNGTVAQSASGNYHHFTYTAETTMGEFTYLTGVFRSDNGFWMIQICSPTAKYDEQTFFTYMDSITIG